MPIQEYRDPTEPHFADAPKPRALDVETDAGSTDEAQPEPFLSDDEVLSYLGETKRTSRNFQLSTTIPRWEVAESAFRSEHHAGSKYVKDQYKNRARYFKPKTRAAVRKTESATRMALFSSPDILSCEAEDDSNPLQRANAALIKEVIDARFNNKTERAGVPWFQTVIGARINAQKQGICCSKQDWSYRCVERTERHVESQPVTGRDGQPVLDFATRQPLMQDVEVSTVVKDVICDKPQITLVPGELVLVNPATDWINPAQRSPTLQVIYPMFVNDVRAMMQPGEDKNTTPWREVSDDDLRAAFYSKAELSGLRQAREGDAGAMQEQQIATSISGLSTEVVEVWENFFRVEDEDYHCWSLKDKFLLSDPTPVREVYPAHRGIRPYVIGTDALEPHVLYPESHVHSWQQSQTEINDFANIRMDATRQSVYPMAKVRAGQNIDYKSVQRRDQQGVVLVKDPTDVTFDRPPGPPAQLYTESNLLGNDLDELAGNFSQNSVQSNRSLNETVGGMQLIAANAGSTSEFDLAVFIETWVEPVLSQVVMLEQYYEDDATLLAVSGQKAKLFQKFGVSEINDELLESQVTLKVNVGVGSADPMMKIMKIKTGMEVSMPFIQMMKAEGKGDIEYNGILSEIWGSLGYKSGADRFIKLKDEKDGPQIPPQAVKQMMAALQAAKQKIDQLEGDRSIDMGKLKIDAAKVEVDRQKVGLEAAKTNADIGAQQHEQNMDRGQLMISAGLPPDYSHEQELQVNQQQFMALMADSAATRNAMVGFMRAMGERAEATDQSLTRMTMQIGAMANSQQASIEAIVAAMTAPKRLVTDAQGHPVGVETVGA